MHLKPKLFVDGSAYMYGTLASDSLKGMKYGGTLGGFIIPADPFGGGKSAVRALNSQVNNCHTGSSVKYCGQAPPAPA